MSCALAAVVSYRHLGSASPGHLGAALNLSLAAAAGLFLTGGVLRLCRWRLANDQRDLLRGCAMTLMGAVSLPLGGLHQLISNPGAVGLGTFGRGASAAICIALVAHAIGVRRRLVFKVVACLGLFVAVAGLGRAVGPQDTMDQGALGAVLLALGWGLLSVLALVRQGARGRAMAITLGALALGELLHSLDGVADGQWTLGGMLLIASVGGAVAQSASHDLADAIREEQQSLSEVERALDSTQERVDRHQSQREELRHDAVNACAGLRGALVTLDKHHDRLSDDEAALLRRAALSEVEHLQHLLGRPADAVVEASCPFDVVALVEATVHLHRALGASVCLTAAPATALGKPHGLTTALQNLLANAAAHAPGAAIRIDVREEGKRAVITVEDDGPGMSRSDVARLLERGQRGPQSRGSGLGLHVARSLMVEQGGDLQVLRCDDGAAFALTLPLSASVARASDHRTPSLS